MLSLLRGQHAVTGLLLLISLISTSTANQVYFQEGFGPGWDSRFTHTQNVKYDGRFSLGKPDSWQDDGLKIPEKSKHYGISAVLPEPATPAQGLVVQYEVKHAAGHSCGGSYLKLLSHQEGGVDPSALNEKTPYSIMFGPDKCGSNGKVHVILRHRNPNNGSVEERHLLNPSPVALPSDSHTHVYTLRLTPPSNFDVLVDGEVKASGDLLTTDAFQPGFQPPTTVADPSDLKPADWADEEFIPDPEAVKPADWDDRAQIPDASAKKPKGWLDNQPASIPDPAAKKPADWDDDEDGEWLAAEIPNPKCKVGCGPWSPPLIRNPTYKGAWKAPLIKNPDWKGAWKPRDIPNPDYWEDKEPLSNIASVGAVAIEVWTVDSDYYFDNIVVASGDEQPAKLREQWRKRHDAEVAAQKEAEAKKAAERKAADAKRAKEAKKGKKAPLTGLPKVVVQALKHNKALRRYTRPITKLIKQAPWTAYLLVAFPPLLLLWPLLATCIPKKRSAVTAADAHAKKHDISGPDDDDTAATDEIEADEQDTDVPQLVDTRHDGGEAAQGDDHAALVAERGVEAAGAVGVAKQGEAGMQGASKSTTEGGSDEYEMVERLGHQMDNKVTPDREEEQGDDEEEEPEAKAGRRKNRRL